LQFPV